MSDTKKIRIIPLGPSDSGKTVFLSLASRMLDKFIPVIGSRKTLQLCLSYLERGEWPPLSDTDYIEEINFSGFLELSGSPTPPRLKVDLSMLDYSGSLLFSKEGVPSGILKKIEMGGRPDRAQEIKLLSSILGASALILFIDPDLVFSPPTREDDPRLTTQREYLSLIELLVNNGLNTRPLMVLLAKRDIIVGAVGYKDIVERAFSSLVNALSTWEPTRLEFRSSGLETTRIGAKRVPSSPLRSLGFDELQAWVVKLATEVNTRQ